MSYQDKLTLDEIAKNDDDMVRDAIRIAYRYRFQCRDAANRFTVNCFNACMVNLAVTKIKKDKKSGHFFSHKQQVRCEERTRYQGVDLWRNGIYIYKTDELAYFVGKPQCEILAVSLPWWVVTNAPVEKKRIISLPAIGNMHPGRN